VSSSDEIQFEGNLAKKYSNEELNKDADCVASAYSLSSRINQCIVTFNDIRAVNMTVCWHHLLFQFSNFECPNLVIYFDTANSNYYLTFLINQTKYVLNLIRIPRMT
jgi:hypothetical protein